jgi:ribosomal protein S18 acetylase RimI-like enzyme
VTGVIIAGADEAQPTVGQLSRLYVDPEFWGSGIGRRLFHTGVAHLTIRGFPQARLWVIEGNLRARRWYERMGWTPTGERKPSCEGAFTCSAGIEDVRYSLPLSQTMGT